MREIMAKKSPGFWFFTGDWLKDTELRFCSLFARGLLVDLLCVMFEAAECGYLSKPDGTPRLDADIVDAISGSTREEKLKALAELESSGVLSRDERNVLYSRRIARLGDLSKTRSKAGSKGGSKPKANEKQTSKQNGSKTEANEEANEEANTQANEKQKGGVTVSVSVSDINTLSLSHECENGLATVPEIFLGEAFQSVWMLWKSHRRQKQKPLGSIEENTQLYELGRFGIEESIAIVRFSIGRGAVNLITNGDHKQQSRHTPTSKQSNQQTKGEQLAAKVAAMKGKP